MLKVRGALNHIRRFHPKQRLSGRALAKEDGFGAEAVANDDDDIDVPEEIESVLEDLFKALRDKDTVVRYSAAKGVARISERLPSDFAEQVLDQVLHLFSIHSAGIASIYDLPSIAEATWHGGCLACAEMTRRGLIPDERLSELVGWLYKVCRCFLPLVVAFALTVTFRAGVIVRHPQGRTLDRIERARRSLLCALVARTGTGCGRAAASRSGARAEAGHCGVV